MLMTSQWFRSFLDDVRIPYTVQEDSGRIEFRIHEEYVRGCEFDYRFAYHVSEERNTLEATCTVDGLTFAADRMDRASRYCDRWNTLRGNPHARVDADRKTLVCEQSWEMDAEENGFLLKIMILPDFVSWSKGFIRGSIRDGICHAGGPSSDRRVV